ncbi:HD-GYP domain-containing protein [Rubeoparvulum massiliense]|uniref:HD-GYP domain-containing protein n=1 Tax=Rubeoparvulum massiliense TaxID=1631346 RepID=UPI00065E597F|nr:HD domain-containing phosphohydrolase [Rubeoparvulum massiliense]
MRYVSLEMVEPGDQLGKSIFSNDGRALLNQGVQLTVGMINQLRRVGVTMLYIQDERFEDIKLEDMVAEETRRETLTSMGEVVQCVQQGQDFNANRIMEQVRKIIDQIVVNKKFLMDIHDIRTVDNHLFLHSLNVCMMSLLIGAHLQLSQHQLEELAIGALFHDLGKLIVEESEEERKVSMTNTQDHTWKGFNILKKKHELSLLSAHVALQHHEFLDGSGYPRGLSGDEIHEFARIVAVTNLYDNLISPFDGERPYAPYEAAEILMGYAEKKLDYEIVWQFLRSVAIYPTGSSLKLSNGKVGVVVDQHLGLPARPVVRIISSSEDEEVEIEEIDLSKQTTIMIEKML